MKKILTILAVILMSSASYAVLQVSWGGSHGFVRYDDSPLLANNSDQFLAQLIWTPHSYIEAAVPGGAVTGDEVLLESRIGSFDGDEYGSLLAQTYLGAFPGAGNIYARVFDIGSNNAGNIVAGTYYYAGPLFAAEDQNVSAPPQVYNMHTSSAGIPGYQTDILNMQVIPEPGTLALLGLGALGLLVRRFKK